jgi:hypothetical protein
MAPYSEPNDLLLGNIPHPSYIDTAKLLQDVADEIDSRIGYTYATPLDVADTSSVARPARLLIKRISRNLATGRLILQVASPEENHRLHAYGWSLVSESLEALKCIAEGDIILDGAPLADGASTPPITAPQIANLDAESNVEAFYNRLANPNYVYTSINSYSSPDSLVR